MKHLITDEQRRLLENYAAILHSMCDAIEASGNFELAIEAIPMLDSARRRMDRMQANPSAYRSMTWPYESPESCSTNTPTSRPPKTTCPDGPCRHPERLGCQ